MEEGTRTGEGEEREGKGRREGEGGEEKEVKGRRKGGEREGSEKGEGREKM